MTKMIVLAFFVFAAVAHGQVLERAENGVCYASTPDGESLKSCQDEQKLNSRLNRICPEMRAKFSRATLDDMFMHSAEDIEKRIPGITDWAKQKELTVFMLSACVDTLESPNWRTMDGIQKRHDNCIKRLTSVPCPSPSPTPFPIPLQTPKATP